MTANDTNNHIHLSAAFELNIGAPILADRVAAGRFLRSTAAREAGPNLVSAVRAPPPAVSLAFASSGQRVILHNNNTSTAEAKRSAKRGEAQASAGAVTGGDGEDAGLQTLNFGKAPTALVAAQLYAPGSSDLASTYDALLFGATTSLLAYDVEQNKQLFYKDVEDGVQAVVCGSVLKSAERSAATAEEGESTPLAIVGGNCSIFGFDRSGAERYWTVTGDQVTAMALLPWQEVPAPSSPSFSSTYTAAPLTLLVASEDFDVRAYEGEEAIVSVHEVDRVQKLVPLWRADVSGKGRSNASAASAESVGRFAYLLENGTVGVYARDERIWRVKGKSTPVSAAFCDVDGDGVEELVVGWSNGRVEVRTDRGGALEKGGGVLYRDTYAAGVAAVLSEDYRQDGVPLPLICTVDGTVRGLQLLEARREEAAEVRQLQILESLMHEKQQLAAQLSSLEEQLALREVGEADTTMPESGVEVHGSYSANPYTRQVEVVVRVTGSAAERGELVVQSCLLQCDAWTSSEEQDAIAFADAEPGTSLLCCFDYPDDVPLAIRACVAVGPPFAESYQIHELEVRVPRFVMYQLAYTLQQSAPPSPMHPSPMQGQGQSQQQSAALRYVPPQGYVLLQWRALLQLDAIEDWLRRSFSVPEDLSLRDANSPTDEFLHLELLYLRDGSSLGVEVHNGTAAGEPYNTLVLHSDRLAPCGEIVNGLVDELHGQLVRTGGGTGQGNDEGSATIAAPAATNASAEPVEVRCEIPLELERLRGILARVDEFNEVRMKLTTDMADAATIVKTLLGRAEDARLLGDVLSMKKAYAALYDVDQELLSENAKRSTNYDELKLALKEVNSCIQHAGKVRIGAARAKLIADCRNALKENKVNSLLEIIRTGSE